jgi:hypothetical protein
MDRVDDRQCIGGRRRDFRFLLAVLLCGAFLGEGLAEEPGKPAFTMQATMVGSNPFQSGYDGSAFPVTLYVTGEATRADFTGPNGERGMMLHDASTNEGWLISLDEGIALPIESPGMRDLLVDPQAPCAKFPGRCQPTRSRFVAGKPAKGWRYRNADGRGPGGTSDGEFWTDPEHGLVLAYRGRKRGWDRTYELWAESVSYGELPEVLFELPDVKVLDDESR